MWMDTCMDMYQHVLRHVCRHEYVCRHVHKYLQRQVYGHVYRHVCRATATKWRSAHSGERRLPGYLLELNPCIGKKPLLTRWATTSRSRIQFSKKFLHSIPGELPFGLLLPILAAVVLDAQNYEEKNGIRELQSTTTSRLRSWVKTTSNLVATSSVLCGLERRFDTKAQNSHLRCN